MDGVAREGYSQTSIYSLFSTMFVISCLELRSICLFVSVTIESNEVFGANRLIDWRVDVLTKEVWEDFVFVVDFD